MVRSEEHSSTLQRAMDRILSTVKWEVVLIYRDDVAIFPRSIEEHLVHLPTGLELL